MSLNCVPETNPFCEQTHNENFMITPKRVRNQESPDHGFIRAKQISQAKAERSISGKINPIDIRSPEKEADNSRGEVNMQNHNIRLRELQQKQTPFTNDNINQNLTGDDTKPISSIIDQSRQMRPSSPFSSTSNFLKQLDQAKENINISQSRYRVPMSSYQVKEEPPAVSKALSPKRPITSP